MFLNSCLRIGISCYARGGQNERVTVQDGSPDQNELSMPCLTPSTGQIFVRDRELRGFGLRVTPGSKSFVLEKQVHGRVRRITLGRYGPLTVELARKLAIEELAAISQGQDPAQEQQDRRHELTFGDLERLYLERHGAYKKSIHNDKSILNHHLAPWRSRKLRAITRSDVGRLHADLGQAGHPTWTNGIVSLIRLMFNRAEDGSLQWTQSRQGHPVVPRSEA
jgi:hypothetical protein